MSVPVLSSKLNKLLNNIKECATAQYNEDTRPTSSSESYLDIASIENVSLSSEHLALVVDGVILTTILSSTSLRQVFLEVACMCKSVLACRVSPEQKRLLVRLVKLKNQDKMKPNPVTLAIG